MQFRTLQYLAVAALLLTGTPVTNAEAPLVKKLTEEQSYEVINASVTAYSGVESCHYPGCPTASGKRAYVGGVACPRSVKLGTKIEIAGKEYTCEDRTAKWIERRYGPAFDIFMGHDKAAHKKALQWGRKKLEVKIYEPPSE